MSCNCKNKVFVPETVLCMFCSPTCHWWNKKSSCFVYHCGNKEILSDPPEWALVHSRKATVGDSILGEIIEDAEYICVRSCFCNQKQCPLFTSR